MEKAIARAVMPVLYVLVIIWTVEVFNFLLGHNLMRFGILPRTTSGLAGIPLSPFIHAGIAHATANTIPILILGTLVCLHSRKAFLQASAMIIVLGGAAVWLLARGAYHAGASGLVFGYFGYLVARAWYDRKLVSLLIAAITVTLYGGILWGVMPTLSCVSWEGHLFGLLAGVVAARLSA